MENTVNNGGSRDNRPGSASAQADASKPATTTQGGAANTAAGAGDDDDFAFEHLGHVCFLGNI